MSYKGIGQIEAIIRREKVSWLHNVAQDLTGEAQRLAPKDEGTLRAAGHWEINGDKAKVIFDTPYAAEQHENLNYTHTDGEAKYLEKPMKAKEQKYAADLAARLRRRLHS